MKEYVAKQQATAKAGVGYAKKVFYQKYIVQAKF